MQLHDVIVAQDIKFTVCHLRPTKLDTSPLTPVMVHNGYQIWRNGRDRWFMTDLTNGDTRNYELRRA